ncbi:unnamed protein product [Chrysodeixis includens]|uniref:Alpha 1,4-glycosyltransferase domain-containing protein n=1 Tax=Chrysodeixis includens TaxID=689277 RepID=A0A9N8KSC9_CHRIL|nr:unnamed protein product [Chrysodeixis includens]
MLTKYRKVCARKRKFILVALLLVLSSLAILNTDYSPDLYFLYWREYENVTCHYSDVGDALPLLGEDFSPPSTSIYFHETSCRGWLNSRQACAIESAARAHKDWNIYVLFAGPVTATNLNSNSFKVLKQLKNVNFKRVHIVDYAKKTPLEQLVGDGALNRTRWRISHTSDMLRYLTLYKWGGVYLDLDVVVVKSLEGLEKNWAARESGKVVAAGALAFSRDELGRKVADAAIRDFKSHYRGDTWSNNGPGVITRVLKTICNTDNVTQMAPNTCNGFGIYGPKLFYPVSWYNAAKYFRPDKLNITEPYAYHVWNKLTENFEIKEDYVYAKIAKKYCPTIYEHYNSNFGTLKY